VGFVLFFLLWEVFAFTAAAGINRGWGQALGGIGATFILAWLLERQLKGMLRIWRGQEAPTGPGRLAGTLTILAAAAFAGFILMCLPYFMRPFTAQRAMLKAITSKVPEAAKLEALDAEGNKRVVETLAGFLKDADPLVRQGAAYELGRLAGKPGVAAADMVPQLAAALKDPEHAVLRQAAGALGVWGRQADAAVPALAEAMEAEQTIPSAAAHALAEMGPAGRGALIAALAEPYAWAAQAAAHELGQQGPQAADAVPALEAARDRAPAGAKISFELAVKNIRK
jgi:HEAT repeat protein